MSAKDWIEMLDSSTNTPYYVNMKTMETSWDIPNGYKKQNIRKVPIFIEKEDKIAQIIYNGIHIKLLLKKCVEKTRNYFIYEYNKENNKCLAKIVILKNEKKGQINNFNPWNTQNILISKTIKIALYENKSDKYPISNILTITQPNKLTLKPRPISLSTVKAIEMDEKNDNIYVNFDLPSNKFTAYKPGIIWVIGENDFGEFGLGDVETKYKLTRCNWSVDKNIIDIASGSMYAIYRSEYGQYYSCGSNEQGQCALNERKDKILQVERIKYFEKNKYIVNDHFLNVNSSNNFWITENGKCFGNGKNENGELGTDDKTNKYEPIELKYFSDKGLNVISVIGSFLYSIALCDNGRVYTIGKSNKGCLGHGSDLKETSEWKEVESLKDYIITQVNCGLDFSLFVDETGNVWTCGNNKYGQLGLGDDCDDKYIYKPTKIKYFEKNNIKIVSVEVGQYNVVAVEENGKIYAWGWNREGQCADGTTTNRKTPQIIETLKDKIIMDIKCGNRHCCAVTDQYEVYMWGNNKYYQCCNGNNKAVTTPQCINDWMSKQTNGGLILSVSLGYDNTKLLIDESNKEIKEEKEEKLNDNKNKNKYESKEENKEYFEFKINYIENNKKSEKISLPISISKSLLPISFTITTCTQFGESIPSDIITIGYQKLSIPIQYLNKNDIPITISFIKLHTSFNQFKQIILDKFKLTDTHNNPLKIYDDILYNIQNITNNFKTIPQILPTSTMCDKCDGNNMQCPICKIQNNKQVREISEINFNTIISKNLYIGYEPKPPIIQHIDNYITGELMIKLQSEFANTFTVELEYLDAETTNEIIYFGPITTQNIILLNTNSFSIYRIRAKGINKFGAKWSESIIYNYKQCVLSATHLTLHQFNEYDICNKIKWFIFNDVYHKQHIQKISKIFEKRLLNGDKICNLTKDDIKSMVEKELSQFMTTKSINIAFDSFEKWRNEKENNAKSKTVFQIAYSIYHFPLFNLLNEIKNKSLNGVKFINNNNYEFIKNITGWDQYEIHQIISFINNNINIKTIQQTSNLDINPSKQNQILAYFMQITLVRMDYFQIKLILDEIVDRDTRFYIKEIDGRHQNEIIVVRKGKNSAEGYIEIEEKDNSYHFGLYDNKHANKSLIGSNTIHINWIKDTKQIPPININYKPKCIDLSTILKRINNKNKEINIFWSIPFESFGDIKYKIIKEEIKEEEEEEIISLLPYSISLSLIPLSFKVITVCTINDKIYESHPSQIITVTSIKS